VWCGILGLCLVALAFRGAIHRGLLAEMLIRQEVPSAEGFEWLVTSSPKPSSILQRFWNTQKIPHRTMTVQYLFRQALNTAQLDEYQVAILKTAVLDGDESVRELALSALNATDNQEIIKIALDQLGDIDPQVRLSGIQVLRRREDPSLLPVLYTRLDDPDWMVVTSAASVLRLEFLN